MRRIHRIIFGVLPLLLLAACGGGGSNDDNGNGGGASVASIAVTPASASITSSGGQQFTAVAKDSTGATLSGITFTWASSNTGVATIDGSGFASGVAVGTSNITAKAGSITSNTAILTVTQASTVTGTAAKGAAIAGAAITLVDSTGKTAPATTGTDGTFSIDTTGLTPPFMVKVVVDANTTFYSVSADTNSSAVINVTPLTDLIIRSWYAVQGSTVETGFDDPAANPPPSPTEVQLISNVVVQVVSLWLQNAGVDTTTFNPITTTFTADGTGADQVLDETMVDTGTGAIAITDGTTTQDSTVTYDTGTGSVNVATTTTGADGSSSSSTSTVVPVSGTQQTALDGITAALTAFRDTVNAKGDQLANTDILSFLDDNLLNEGLDKAQFAASTATQFRGLAISFTVLSIASLDDTAGIADVNFLATVTQGSASQTEAVEFQFKQQSDGSWLLYGNQKVARLSIDAEMRTNQGAITSDNGPDINVDVSTLQGLYSGVTVTGGGVFSSTALTSGSTRVDTFNPTPSTTLVVNWDAFFANTGVLANLVPAGTPITVTLTPVSGSPVSYTVNTNAFTTEPISITNLTGTTIADANLGNPLHVTWTLPKTFAIQEVRLNAQTFTGDQTNPATLNCNNDDSAPVIAPTATSADITIPTTCAGQPVLQADLNLSVRGVNGERETVIYFFQ